MDPSLTLIDQTIGRVGVYPAEDEAVVDALKALITATNNGKVLAISEGALAAVTVESLITDGDEVSY